MPSGDRAAQGAAHAVPGGGRGVRERRVREDVVGVDQLVAGEGPAGEGALVDRDHDAHPVRQRGGHHLAGPPVRHPAQHPGDQPRVARVDEPDGLVHHVRQGHRQGQPAQLGDGPLLLGPHQHRALPADPAAQVTLHRGERERRPVRGPGDQERVHRDRDGLAGAEVVQDALALPVPVPAYGCLDVLRPGATLLGEVVTGRPAQRLLVGGQPDQLPAGPVHEGDRPVQVGDRDEVLGQLDQRHELLVERLLRGQLPVHLRLVGEREHRDRADGLARVGQHRAYGDQPGPAVQERRAGDRLSGQAAPDQGGGRRVLEHVAEAAADPLLTDVAETVQQAAVEGEDGLVEVDQPGHHRRVLGDQRRSDLGEGHGGVG